MSWGITPLNTLQDGVLKFAQAMDANMTETMQFLTLETIDRLRDITPVDTGRARASWFVGLWTPSTEQAPPKTKPGVLVYQKPPPPDVSGVDFRTKVYITSTLEYIGVLEDGRSGQAPVGMVRVVVPQLREEILSVIGSLNSR